MQKKSPVHTIPYIILTQKLKKINVYHVYHSAGAEIKKNQRLPRLPLSGRAVPYSPARVAVFSVITVRMA